MSDDRGDSADWESRYRSLLEAATEAVRDVESALKTVRGERDEAQRDALKARGERDETRWYLMCAARFAGVDMRTPGPDVVFAVEALATKAADAVRLQADLLTARHDLHEFSRELEAEREEHAAEVADLRATIVAQARRLAKLESE